MRNFTLEDLKHLSEIEGECCISFYLPTSPGAAHTDAQRIRFKNLLRRAENTIQELAPKNKELSARIAEGERLLANDPTLRAQSDGMAVFIAPDLFRYFLLPERFEETFHVSRRLYIKPLLPLFMSNGRFFILALSQHQVRLFSCTRHRVMEIAVDGLPETIDAALQYDSKDRQLQFHTGATDGVATGASGRPAIFHGHGVSIDDHKDEVYRYFQKVDQPLQDVLADRQEPLVLAGVDYLLPLFRKATAYRNVLEGAVTGNPDNFKPEELHRKALEIVIPELERQQRETRRQYHELAGKGYTAAGVQSVVPAAAYGKVDALFVALDERRPGTFDRQNNEVTVLDQDDPRADDLLNLAAAFTLQHGGRIYAFRNETLPEKHAEVAAILRY